MNNSSTTSLNPRLHGVADRLRASRYGRYLLALAKAVIGYRGTRRDHLLEAEFYALASHRRYAVGGASDSGYFVGSTSDLSVSCYIYSSDTYELGRLQRALSIANVSQDKTVIDVGANIGTAGLGALVSGAVSHCVSIEPDPTNYRLLRTNVMLNDLADRVTTINCAVGSNDNVMVRFASRSDYLGGSQVSETGNIEVPMRTLATLREEYHVPTSAVGLVWVDVEGLEANVIASDLELFAASAWVLELRSEITDLAPLARLLLGRRVIVLTEHDRFDVERELGQSEIQAMIDGSAGLIAYDVLVLPVKDALTFPEGAQQ